MTGHKTPIYLFLLLIIIIVIKKYYYYYYYRIHCPPIRSFVTVSGSMHAFRLSFVCFPLFLSFVCQPGTAVTTAITVTLAL